MKKQYYILFVNRGGIQVDIETALQLPVVVVFDNQACKMYNRYIYPEKYLRLAVVFDSIALYRWFPVPNGLYRPLHMPIPS